MRQAFLNLGHHIRRQIVNQVGNLVRIKPFDGIDELLAVHRIDQGFTNAFAHLDQNVTFVLMTHEVPHRQTLFRRQCFENVSNVSRMQIAQNIGKFSLGCQIKRSGIRFLGIVARDLASVFLIFEDLGDALQGAIGHFRIARQEIVFCCQELFFFVVGLCHCVSPCGCREKWLTRKFERRAFLNQ